jgi:hypothetical protein
LAGAVAAQIKAVPFRQTGIDGHRLTDGVPIDVSASHKQARRRSIIVIVDLYRLGVQNERVSLGIHARWRLEGGRRHSRDLDLRTYRFGFGHCRQWHEASNCDER